MTKFSKMTKSMAVAAVIMLGPEQADALQVDGFSVSSMRNHFQVGGHVQAASPPYNAQAYDAWINNHVKDLETFMGKVQNDGFVWQKLLEKFPSTQFYQHQDRGMGRLHFFVYVFGTECNYDANKIDDAIHRFKMEFLNDAKINGGRGTTFGTRGLQKQTAQPVKPAQPNSKPQAQVVPKASGAVTSSAKPAPQQQAPLPSNNRYWEKTQQNRQQQEHEIVAKMQMAALFTPPSTKIALYEHQDNEITKAFKDGQAAMDKLISMKLRDGKTQFSTAYWNFNWGVVSEMAKHMFITRDPDSVKLIAKEFHRFFAVDGSKETRASIGQLVKKAYDAVPILHRSPDAQSILKTFVWAVPEALPFRQAVRVPEPLVLPKAGPVLSMEEKKTLETAKKFANDIVFSPNDPNGAKKRAAINHVMQSKNVSPQFKQELDAYLKTLGFTLSLAAA